MNLFVFRCEELLCVWIWGITVCFDWRNQCLIWLKHCFVFCLMWRIKQETFVLWIVMHNKQVLPSGVVFQRRNLTERDFTAVTSEWEEFRFRQMFFRPMVHQAFRILEEVIAKTTSEEKIIGKWSEKYVICKSITVNFACLMGSHIMGSVRKWDKIYQDWKVSNDSFVPYLCGSSFAYYYRLVI